MFWPALVLIVAFVTYTYFLPDDAGTRLGAVSGFVINTFGWYYTVLVTAFVVFAIWVGVGHFGDIKLAAKDDDEPEFKLGSWFAMLFACGMGIGLVFWGAAEPLSHLAGVPNRATGIGYNEQGAQGSMVQTFLHWGLHPWAIYVVAGLALAYAVHRKGRPMSIRWSLEPLLGKRVVSGWLGDVIDVIAVVGTLFGVATSLGLGVSQISAGLGYVGLISKNPGNFVLIMLIVAITTVAVLSVVSGVKRGIKWLSNANMVLALGMLVFVLVVGPTLFLLREFIESIGLYFQNLLQLSFSTTAYQEDGSAWQGWWTAFYWGWWISWAPFVGVFIARISRGRTVREFVAGVLLVPTLLSFLWFSVFGGAALWRELFSDSKLVPTDDAGQPLEGLTEDGASVVNETNVLFDLLGGLPGGAVVVFAAILLIVLFFVTSSDSGSLVVDMLASGGDPEPPTWSRILWASLEGAVAIALLLAGGGGLWALRYASIIIALPFSIVMILMAISTWRGLAAERRALVTAQRRIQREEMTEHVSQSLIEEGLIESNSEVTAGSKTT
ncbi:MAG: BCCT family transporter [Micromonosporaceae bacterium]